MTSAFRLYKEETSWWSFHDHAVVLAITERLKAKRVLEFGPGSSTLALIEGGATAVDCCEDDPIWFATYCERLEDVYPNVIRMRPYRWNSVPCIHGVDTERYDLALIDGPKETERRAAVIVYAMAHCDNVLVALEEHSPGERLLRRVVVRFANLFGRPVEWIENTGPLAGAFALVGPPC